MKKRFYQLLSLTLFLAGLSLIDTRITASVIGASSQGSIIGVLLILISGIIFVASKGIIRKKLGRSLAKQLLIDKHIPNTPRELISTARKMGYTLMEKKKHTHIYIKTPKGKYRLIDRIPRHRIINRNTSKSILKTLDDYAAQVS